jgi:hypothetical protein
MTRRAIVRLLAFSLSANAASSPLWAGVPAKKAAYRGGTLSHIETAEAGRLSLSSPEQLLFAVNQTNVAVRYSSIRGLEYGQHAGRRLGLAIAVSPLFLLSKKRKHYLTIHFVDDDGIPQAAVFELGKKIIRTTLAALSARTGLRIEFQDEEARKSGGL